MNEDMTRDMPVVHARTVGQAPPLHETTERLAHVVHEGARTMPENRPLLVCKPKNVESWRIFKIMSEFIEGFDIIRRYGLAVTFFGSARATPEDESYQRAQELSAKLAKVGFAVITGGSSGIMEAANKGAFQVGGASVGLNINLPTSQLYNPYLTEKFGFDHFFVRKVMLTYASEVYVYFPGGFGTLDEFFEIVTLVQTKKIRNVPIVLFGKSYWEPLMTFMQKTLLEDRKTIDAADLDLFTIVDTIDEAYDYITKNVTC
ncbi:MAG: Cytokinin riboside 5-monophosphate phosphoribohydrolase [Parcubacteria group bacterium]|nr:Cytokinin riboside 5-monophosphate phosphoribohydrolase [Parcubacteria group bacterium]